MTDAFAVVSDYRELAKAVRDRIVQLDISLETAEELAGIQPGYLAKITADPPLRRAAPWIWFLVLSALGLRIALVDHPELIEKLRHRWEPRKTTRPKNKQAS